MIAAFLTVDAIYSAHPIQGVAPSGFTWSPDGTRLIYIVASPDIKTPPVIRIRDVRSGSDGELFRARAQVRGSRSRPISEIVWSPQGNRIAFINGGDLWIADANGGRPFRIASDADDPQWSPNGTRIAYVHANDVYAASLATRRASRLTFDGSQTRINGDPDWLYSEELDVAHAYAWSPKGDAIAYLSFDESHVTPFPIQDYLPTVNTVEYQQYPLAGAANPRVSLHVVDLTTQRSRTLYDGAPHDEYLVSFVWAPAGNAVLDEILDRAQQHLRLELLAADGSWSKTVWRETSPYFVDVQPAPKFFPDGRSIAWLSARSGVQGVYRVDLGSGAARLLSGRLPVSEILRCDAHGVFATALAPSRRDQALTYISSTGPVRVVTAERGWHDVVMPERGSAYLDTFSSFKHAPTVTIRSLNSSRSDVLFATPSLAQFDLGNTRALEIPTRWGSLDAELTVPSNFDSHRHYPVIVTAYGGPLPVGDALPSADRWQGLYTYLLAQDGFLVFTIDGPASNEDRVSNEYLFRYTMGDIAMAGQLAGVEWLKRQPYVDASRLGLFGWSYGGYLTAFTLTHAPGVFRSGIAGAPPADWHYYDTAYTERYMGMPRREAAAYHRTSVLPAASRLDSQLLIIQGSSDDNVHLMNSISLLEAFIGAGKQVHYFLYPGARHGVVGVAAQRNLYTRMLRWWEDTLLR
jgi:dipeptidyl-peptidase-4